MVVSRPATLVAQSFWRARCALASAGPVLDAGCGTGGMLLRSGPRSPAVRPSAWNTTPMAAALAAAKAGRPVAAGSVNEMPLGDGTLGGYVSLDVLCHGGVEPGACPEGGAALPAAGRDRALQSAGLWLAVVGA